MNNKYSLQLLHHDSVFPTREEAIAYINERFKNNALLAEPAVVMYGDSTKPNVLLAICSGNERVFLIDAAKMTEEISNVQEEATDNTELINEVSVALRNVVEECGFEWDTNKKENQIEYVPNSKDELISNASNLAEAIGVISEYVQEQFASSEMSVENTDSINLNFVDNPKGGKLLTASLNVSKYGDADDLDYNNNVVGIKDDGVFACVNLEFDDERRALVFTASGIRNGRFVDDANKKIIELGKHTQYTANNIDHTVNLVIDQDTNVMYGEVKLSEDNNNILVKQDGKLLVDGRAKNIAYKNTTVFAGINTLESAVQNLQEAVENIENTHVVKGDETDTMIITSAKQSLGGYKISGDVRLGANKSIKVSEGGLVADIKVDVDATNNTLILNVGTSETRVALPGVTLVDDIQYVPSTRCIVITTTDGKHVTIPMGDLIQSLGVENDADSPIVLTKSADDKLSASVRISSNVNNMLTNSNGELFVDEGIVKTSVETEANRAIGVENELKARIENHEATVSEKFNETDAKISLNATNIVAEQSRAELAEQQLMSDVANLVSSLDETKENVANNSVDIEDHEHRLTIVEEKVAENANDIASNLAAINTNADNIDALADRVTVNEEKVTQHNLVVTEQIGNLASKDDELASQINTVSEKLTIEVNRATEKEGALLDKINEVASNLTDEAANRQTQDTAIVGQITAISEAVNKLNEGEDTPGSVVNIVSHAVNDVMGVLNNEVVNRENADTALNEKVDTLKTNVEASIANTADNAKTYTDNEVNKLKVGLEHQIENAEESAVDTASADATAKAGAALADAKAYTDVEKERAMTVEGGLASDIAALQTKDSEIEASLANKIETVTIEKNSVSDLQYTLLVNGQPSGEINIPKDQFLKDVVYDSGNKRIVFDFETSSGVTQTFVDVSDLVDTYNGGQGISLVGNVFSIKVNEDSEAYLKLTDEGLAIMGINDALVKKANANDVYTKSEVDSFNEGLGNRIDNVVSEVVTVNSTVADHSESIAKLDGNEAVTGSVSNAIKVSKEYTDAQIDTANSALSNKANVGDSYTKSEIDNMGFLTEHQSLDLINSSIDEIKAVNDSQYVRLDSLESEAVRLNLTAIDGQGIETNISKTDTGTTIKSSIKRNNSVPNIIQVNNDGISANVTLAYDSVGNKLTFNNGGDPQEIQLTGVSLIQDVQYDNDHQEIILTFVTERGEEVRRIYIGDLVDVVKVGDRENSPIILYAESDDNGITTITGDVQILNNPNNALIRDNGALYVSKNAVDHDVSWGDGENNVISVQSAINTLKEGVEGLQHVTEEVAELKSDFSTIKTDVDSLRTKSNELTTDFATLEADFRIVSANVATYEDRISGLEDSVKKIEKMIGDMEGDKSIAERLASIDETLANLIDFGEYSNE